MQDFADWLEVISIREGNAQRFPSLDALDSVLLSNFVECEKQVPFVTNEERMQKLWQASFASHTAAVEDRLAFVRRGLAMPQLYPEPEERRRIYQTGLPPSAAFDLIRDYSEIKGILQTGTGYAAMNSEEQFNYLSESVSILQLVSRFGLGVARSVWEPRLRWWLLHQKNEAPPAKKIGDWQGDIGKWFSYRCSWGIGSIIGYAISISSKGETDTTTFEQWEKLELPWVVFWMKELLSWGTVDPVAAFLMTRGLVLTRPEAEKTAKSYYSSEFARRRTDALDPRSIRDWVDGEYADKTISDSGIHFESVPVKILAPEVAGADSLFRVFPATGSKGIHWIDIAGYELALSSMNQGIEIQELDFIQNDFLLNPAKKIVTVSRYL